MLSATGMGTSVRKALEASYAVLMPLPNNTPTDTNKVWFNCMHYRPDIGASCLALPTRVGILRSTRGTDLEVIVATIKDSTHFAFGRVGLAVCIPNKRGNGILDRAMVTALP